METSDIQIPKHRFDEVNDKYKETKEQLIEIKKILMSKDFIVDKLKNELENLKDQIAKEKRILKLKEIFLDGGLKASEYENILQRIHTPNEEEAIILAKEIVKVILQKTNNN